MITIQEARKARQKVTPVYNREGEEGHIDSVLEKTRHARVSFLDRNSVVVPLTDLWSLADWRATFNAPEQGEAPAAPAPEFEVRSDEPNLTRLIWVVEGLPMTGTVRDLAKTIEYATHAGENCPTAIYAVTSDGKLAEATKVETRGSEFDENDYSDRSLSVWLGPVELRASYRIDGRV